MRKRLHNIVFLLIIIFPLLIGAVPVAAGTEKSPEANLGVIDLTDWNWAEQSILSLDGQWEFYWQQLLTPEDFPQAVPSSQGQYIEQPRAWNNMVVKGTLLPGNGYATYRLVVRQNADEVLALKLPRILTSYKLWVNDELVATAGKIATDQNMIPQYLPQVVVLKPQDGSLELVFQVANFRHRSGGILESIRLGTAASIMELRSNNLTLELFLFGGLFIIGFYHLALYIFRTKDKSALYFALYSLLISVRTLLVGEIYLIHIFPFFSWELAHKIQTLAYYLGLYLIYQFIKAVFPLEISKKISYFIQTVALSFAAIVIFTPARIFTIVNPAFQLFSIFVIIYLASVVLKACLKKREGAHLIGVGILVFFIFAINDIIFLSIFYAETSNRLLRSIITRGNLSSIGLLSLTFVQSLVLAKKFSKSFADVELLSEELQVVNATLEEKVQERTEALEASKEELRLSYEAVSRSERSLQFFMQNFSHDLRNPLTAIKGYVTAVLDGVIKGQEQQQKYLYRTIEKVNYINKMVQEILEFAQLQSRQLQLSFQQIPVNSFISSSSDKYLFEMKNNYHVNFQVNTPSAWSVNYPLTANLAVLIDTQKIERVFTNLLSNSVKYSPDKADITLDFSFTDDLRTLQVAISDKGLGISREELSHIFDRFYKSSRTNQEKTGSSFGLGLSIARELIVLHGGEIWVESEPGQGSSFIFTLPMLEPE